LSWADKGGGEDIAEGTEVSGVIIGQERFKLEIGKMGINRDLIMKAIGRRLKKEKSARAVYSSKKGIARLPRIFANGEGRQGNYEGGMRCR